MPRFPRLPLKEEAISLLCLCVVPYLRAKLEDRVTQYQLLGVSQGWVQALLRLHSTLHFMWEGSVLSNYMSYMTGHAASHSPLLHLAGVTLQYAAEHEQESKYGLYIDCRNGNRKIGSYLVHLAMLLDVQVSPPVTEVHGVPADVYVGVWSILSSVPAVLAPG
jgi:hypothetical protein